jgi:hypothetical protein
VYGSKENSEDFPKTLLPIEQVTNAVPYLTALPSQWNRVRGVSASAGNKHTRTSRFLWLAISRKTERPSSADGPPY